LSKLPNQKEVLPRFRDLSTVKGVMRDGKVYSIPFCFDSIGIIYDKDKVSPAPDSFETFWDEKYKGKILAYDNGEHNFSFTALTLGIEDPFHLSEEQMGKIKEKLIALKHNVLSFYTTPDEALQLYKSNDVALIWANYGQQQVKAMKDAGANIEYVNPKEGALAWLDTWAMTNGVQDVFWRTWVNFLLQKKIGQRSSAPAGNAIPDRRCGNDKLVGSISSDPTKRSDCGTRSRRSPERAIAGGPADGLAGPRIAHRAGLPCFLSVAHAADCGRACWRVSLMGCRWSSSWRRS
jgi:putative spermidine/putrescine transport system substrate-binding protein